MGKKVIGRVGFRVYAGEEWWYDYFRKLCKKHRNVVGALKELILTHQKNQ